MKGCGKDLEDWVHIKRKSLQRVEVGWNEEILQTGCYGTMRRYGKIVMGEEVQ